MARKIVTVSNSNQKSPSNRATMSLAPSHLSAAVRVRRPKAGTPESTVSYVIALGKQYLGPDMESRVTRPEQAASWPTEAEALSVSQAVGGEVRPHRTDRSAPLPESPSSFEKGPSAPVVEVTTPAPEALSEAPVSPSPEAAAKFSLPRDRVMAKLLALGYRVFEKSSTHVGPTETGPRMVIPKGPTVRRVFLYRVEDPSLPGFVAAADRKARKLGTVTCVCDLESEEDLTRLIAGLVLATGGALS